jgi:hypothetical protein
MLQLYICQNVLLYNNTYISKYLNKPGGTGSSSLDSVKKLTDKRRDWHVDSLEPWINFQGVLGVPWKVYSLESGGLIFSLFFNFVM